MSRALLPIFSIALTCKHTLTRFCNRWQPLWIKRHLQSHHDLLPGAIGWFFGLSTIAYPLYVLHFQALLGCIILAFAYQSAASNTHARNTHIICISLMAYGIALAVASASVILRKQPSIYCYTHQKTGPATKILHGPAQALHHLMIYGKKGSASEKDKNCVTKLLKKWGMEHILARSGLHVVIGIGLLNLLLLLFGPIGSAWYVRKVILLCCCMLYAFFSPLTISCIRALLAYSIDLVTGAAGMATSVYDRWYLTFILGSLIGPVGPISLLYLGTWLTYSLSWCLIFAYHNASTQSSP